MGATPFFPWPTSSTKLSRYKLKGVVTAWPLCNAHLCRLILHHSMKEVSHCKDLGVYVWQHRSQNGHSHALPASLIQTTLKKVESTYRCWGSATALLRWDAMAYTFGLRRQPGAPVVASVSWAMLCYDNSWTLQKKAVPAYSSNMQVVENTEI